MFRNKLKNIFIIPGIITALWCCETGFIEIEKDCYFHKDLQFLQALITNRQFNRKSPPADLNPIEWRHKQRKLHLIQ